MTKGIQIVLGATVIAGLVAWYASSNLQGYRYFQTLDEFHASADVVGEFSKVHGYVAPGSIERDVEALAVRFAVQNDPPHAGGPAGTLLRVELAGLETPDLFKDGAEVVVEGHLTTAGGTFHADKVFAKCPSKFEAKAAEAGV